MPQQYSIDQAQSNLNEIIDVAEQGNPVEIFKSGKRVAVVLSSEEYARLTTNQQPDFWQALQAFQQDTNLQDLNLELDTFEGLRDRSTGREVDW